MSNSKSETDQKPIVDTVTTEATEIPDYLLTLLNEIAAKEHFTDYTIESASGSNIGDGFQGLMLRVSITGKRKATSGENVKSAQCDELLLICKIPPLSEFRRQMSKDAFQKEVYVYDKLLPAFVKFQQAKDIPVAETFNEFPKCYGTYSNDETSNYAIVLEDLRNRNHEMWNKFEELDFGHASLAVQTIGKFHALSFALRDQQPELFAEISQIQSTAFRQMVEQKFARDFLEKAYEKALDTLSATETELTAKVKQLQRTFPQHLLRCTDLNTNNSFAVLNHGDFWNNNMMFEYANGGSGKKVANSVCLIDWQLGQFGSPAVDLTYYLYSSTEQPLRDQHFDDLLKVYYDSLAVTLRRLGSDPERLFTFDDLQAQLKEYGVYGFMIAPMLVQVVTVTAADIPNMDELTEDSDLDYMRNGVSDAYRVRMHDVIKDWVGRGYDL